MPLDMLMVRFLRLQNGKITEYFGWIDNIPVCGYRKKPPGHHGREGFVHLWDYPSISMFSPDLSSTVKWSSQTMIRSSHRFTRASPKASKRAGGCLMKVLQLVDAGNLCVSGSSIDRTFFSLFPELEDLVGNLIISED